MEKCYNAMRAMRRFSQVYIALPKILARITTCSKDGGTCILKASESSVDQ